MLEWLKEKAYISNIMLQKYNLVTFTWGNASEIDRDSGMFAIKPSGIEYEKLRINDMVLIDLDGNKIEGKYNPSSDTETHLELYKSFNNIGGIVHTHSSFATSWAQSGKDIPCYGTTHADYIYGKVPCVRNLTKKEVDDGYEKNIGKLIVEYFKDKDYNSTPAILCKNHGPFTWGENSYDALHNAVVLEEIAKMAIMTKLINNNVRSIPNIILDKHYFRKHGKNAYYGQINI